MTPDEIKRFIQTNYQGIYCKRLKRGWSFWYREPISRPDYSTRIARATQSRGGSTRFKLAVTSILTGKDDVRSIASQDELRRLFDQEFKLRKQNYKP